MRFQSHWLIVLLVVLGGRLPAATLSTSEVLDWVESLGGRYSRAENGDVTGVNLSSAWVTDTDLQKLTYLPNLQRINLSYVKISDLALEHLIPLENVRDLNLHFAEYITDNGIAHLKGWTHLEHLNVRGTKVTSSIFRHIAGMTKLKSLDVGFSRTTDDGFEHLAGMEQLERLAFGGNKMSGLALPLLKLLPSLKELNVSGWQRTDSGLWGVSVTDFNLDSIAELKQLEVLDLGETRITDPGLPKLLQLESLRSLDLSRTAVTARGMAALAALPNLRRLRLWQAERINDSAIPHFLEMKKLEVLELPETGISDKGLAQLQEAKHLKRLYVGGSDVTIDEVERFRKALPNCLISWWAKSADFERVENENDVP